MQSIKFLLDTNAINRIVKGKIEISKFDRNHEYFITSVQEIELSKTNNIDIREKLLSGLKTIKVDVPVKNTNLETACWDNFYWGEMDWGQEGGHYDRLREKLGNYPGKKNNRGNVSDALILEVCIMQKLTIVSDDKAIQSVCSEENISCLTLSNFKNKYRIIR